MTEVVVKVFMKIL